ncbi:MAG TPA: isoprenyl transferase [Ignavibacteriales bacterium]|jgi:undecaprenyl diphosphate synthase|nr:isoprenyl transferase [Ignavibacteriales bacterium]
MKLEILINQIKKQGNIPSHVAIIMDGNGRWAKMRNRPRVYGHQKGVKTVKKIIEAAKEIDVKYLTLYTFSTENWNRPQDEVSTLMKLLVSSLRRELDEMISKGVKLNTIGDIDLLPIQVKNELIRAIEKTKNNDGIVVTLALSYSGRWEILHAMREISKEVKNGKISPDDIDEELVSKSLLTKDLPDPDLMIRTGGEYRISNFLLWQLAYAELYICDVYWPEFGEEHFYKAIIDYQSRERRFGKISEQIKINK